MQLDDIRVAESITAAELAVGDFHLVYDASADKWKRLVHSEGNKENKPVTGTPVKAVKAYGETNLAGSNNDIRWTAATAGVSLASIAYPAATAVATTVASASGVAVSVQTGTKARMLVSGTTPAVATVVFYADYLPGHYLYTSDGAAVYLYGDIRDALRTVLYSSGTEWTLWHWDSNGDLDYTATKTSAATSPDGLTSWTVALGTDSPTIAAAVSSAAQVIAAVAADAASAALMVGTNKAGNDGTGAVDTLATTLLTALSNPVAGVDGTPASAGDQFMDGSYLYTALTDMTISTLTGWMTSPLTALT